MEAVGPARRSHCRTKSDTENEFCVVSYLKSSGAPRILVTASIREFGLQYAGRTGADEYADSMSAVLLCSKPDAGSEIVLLKSKLRQSVVATIEIG